MCQGNGNGTDTKPNESRNELFAASFHFKCRILAKSTKNPACTEIEAAVGKCRTAAGNEPYKNCQSNRRESKKNSDNQENKGCCKSREPSGMHCRKTDNKLSQDAGNSSIQDPKTEIWKRHACIKTCYKRQKNCRKNIENEPADNAVFNCIIASCVLIGFHIIFYCFLAFLLQEYHQDLECSDEAGTNHESMRHVERIEINPEEHLGIAAEQKANGKHQHSPHIGNHGDSKC